MRTLTVVVAAAMLSQSPPPGGGLWPPNGVYPPGSVDTPPKVVTRVDPKYTGSAIRARIEGIVHLVCVVNADGTVGDTRVAKSLDATNGLDEAAIASVRQWHFSPATKDGRAVPTAVAVDVAFTLRGAPRPMTWPEGFAPADTPPAAQWRTEISEAEGLRLELAVPPGWTLQPKAANAFAMLRKTGTLSTFSVAPPHHTAEFLDRAMTPVELQQAADRMERTFGGQMLGLESLGFGQANAAGHLWAWHAYKTQTAVPPNLDPKIAPTTDKLFESIREWTFDTTVDGQAIEIICFALVPRSGTDQEKAAWVRDQAAAFGEILRRMKVSTARE